MPSLTHSKKQQKKLSIEDVYQIYWNYWILYLLSITGTSTACSVFGRSRDPGLSAPQPAAHPNLPKKSSFLSGKQIGAENKNKYIYIFELNGRSLKVEKYRYVAYSEQVVPTVKQLHQIYQLVV